MERLYHRQKFEFHYVVLDACLDLWLPVIAKSKHFLLGNKHRESICPFIPNVSFLCRAHHRLVLHSVDFQSVSTKTSPNISNQENWCYIEVTNTCTLVSPLIPKEIVFGQIEHPGISLEKQNTFIRHHMKGREKKRTGKLLQICRSVGSLSGICAEL